MKFQIEVMTTVEIPYNPAQYPANMTPQEALSLEIEELSKDPKELMALDSEVIGVRGVVLQDEREGSLRHMQQPRSGSERRRHGTRR